MGFHFRAYAALWEERLGDLKKYKEKHGTVHVKSSHDDSLYVWMIRQRQTFRDFMEGRKSPMDHDRIRKLEDMGEFCLCLFLSFGFFSLLLPQIRRERHKSSIDCEILKHLIH